MKKKSLLFLTMGLCSFALFSTPAKAASEPLYSITIDRLTLDSYSTMWNEEKLHMLYDELVSNHHGDEFVLLSKISLYPDSPYGVLGYYIEDTYIQNNGNVIFGNKAEINLYQANTFNTIETIAPLLAHEYGHHFTIVNFSLFEQKYYPNWQETEYGKVRNLLDKSIFTSTEDENYSPLWDIVEIAANDYVQLLGSYYARAPYPYLDAKDLVTQGEGSTSQPVAFNLQPQANMHLPLATEVSGLYEYFVQAGNLFIDTKAPKMHVKPVIEEIIKNETEEYTNFYLFFEGPDNSDYSYTVVMHPKQAVNFPKPIKWVAPNEARFAVFGTFLDFVNGEALYIQNQYEGLYEFRVYAQDENGFIFSSDPYLYDFGQQEEVSVNSYIGTIEELFVTHRMNSEKRPLEQSFEQKNAIEKLFLVDATLTNKNYFSKGFKHVLIDYSTPSFSVNVYKSKSYVGELDRNSRNFPTLQNGWNPYNRWDKEKRIITNQSYYIFLLPHDKSTHTLSVRST